MANLIQVKRSAGTALPAGLQPGELAYASNGEVLFVGSAVGSNTANVVAIGGKRTPGTLTANQAIVVNASSWVDTIQTAKLIIGATTETINIASISVAANSTQLGGSASGSNTELVTSYAIKTYVDGKTTAIGGAITNTYIAYSDSGVLAGDSDFKWDKSTKTFYVSNTANVNGTLTVAGLTTFNGDVQFGNAATDNVAFTAKFSSSLIPYHGSTHDLGNTSFYWGNAYIGTGNFNAANVNGVLAAGNTTITGFANISSTLAAGSTTISGTLGAGNTTITGFANVSSTLAAGNTTITGFANVTTTLAAGNTTISGTLGAGNTTITGFANVTTTLAAGNTTITGFANVTTTLAAGNTTITGFANVSSTLAAGNTTITGFANVSSTANVGGATTLRSTLTVNGAVTIANTLATGNTTITGFANVTTTLAAGNTTITGLLAAGNTTITGFANVSSTANVGGATTLRSTLTVNGAVTIANTLATGNTTITGFANVTTTLAAGNTTITGFANVSTTLQVGGVSTLGANVNVTGTVNATAGKFGDLDVSGNLTVTGTLTTVNANNLVVQDSMIQLASNNTTTDVIDIGFFGSYEGGSAPHEHTGLFRDATDGRYKLFQGLEPSPTTTVDTANATFQYATLRAFLETGGAGATGLIANSTAIVITANSTLSVNVVANTLSLSTALAGNSGGTGLASYTAEDILVANSTNGFRKLALGTDGYVLQSNGTALIYNTLDGGTF